MLQSGRKNIGQQYIRRRHITCVGDRDSKRHRVVEIGLSRSLLTDLQGRAADLRADTLPVLELHTRAVVDLCSVSRQQNQSYLFLFARVQGPKPPLQVGFAQGRLGARAYKTSVLGHGVMYGD